MSIDLKCYYPVHPKWPDWYLFVEYGLGFAVEAQADGIRRMLTTLRKGGRIELCDRDTSTFVYVVYRANGAIAIADNMEGVDVKIIFASAQMMDEIANQIEAAMAESEAS